MSDAKNVKLTISAIKNPWAVYSGFTWKVSTMRFQTKTIIEQASSPSGTITVVAGTLTTADYKSSWSVASTKLVNSTKVFMDASITTVNTIYRNS